MQELRRKWVVHLRTQSADGYFDNVVVTTTAGETVYDFEPVPQSKSDCAGGGWQDYGTQFKNQGQCVKFIAAGKR